MSTKKVPDEVIEVLVTCEVNGNAMTMPPMAPALYQKVKKFILMMGGKWVGGKTQAHIFPEDPSEVIQNVVTFREIVDHKKLTQFFPTPMAVVERICTAADPQEFHRILEPSAGEGAIISGLLEVNSDYENPIDVFELDEKRQQILQSKFGSKISVRGADFMAARVSEQYDLVVMNPPFSKSQDVKHVLQAFEMLNEGGRLVAITSPGWCYRQTEAHLKLRQMINSMGWMEELEEGEFKESGTNIKTCLVVLDKL